MTVRIGDSLNSGAAPVEILRRALSARLSYGARRLVGVEFERDELRTGVRAWIVGGSWSDVVWLSEGEVAAAVGRVFEGIVERLGASLRAWEHGLSLRASFDETGD